MSRTCVIARAVCVSLLHPMEALAGVFNREREKRRDERREERGRDKRQQSRRCTGSCTNPQPVEW